MVNFEALLVADINYMLLKLLSVDSKIEAGEIFRDLNKKDYKKFKENLIKLVNSLNKGENKR